MEFVGLLKRSNYSNRPEFMCVHEFVILCKSPSGRKEQLTKKATSTKLSRPGKHLKVDAENHIY